MTSGHVEPQVTARVACGLCICDENHEKESMMHINWRYSLALIGLGFVLPLLAHAQTGWTFEGSFPNAPLDVGTFGGHGITVDPGGKIWFQPLSATDSVQVPDLGNEFRGIGVIYVFNSDGTSASFSPIKFVDLPGGERDTLGGFIRTNLNGSKVWESRRGRGLRSDADGNIIVSQQKTLYKLNYQTGAGLAKARFDDYCDLTASATDGLGKVYVASMCPGPPIRVLDGGLQVIGNAVDASHGFSRSFEVSGDGNTIYWAAYTNHAVVVYQRPDEFSAYDSLGVVLQGFDSESMTINPVTGNLWLSAGSSNDVPNRYPGITTSWLPQTWYEFSLDSLVPNAAPPPALNLLSWQNSEEWSEGRPRGLAFSPDGMRAYATQFFQPEPAIQVFDSAPFNASSVTVRDINAIEQVNIDQLNSAGSNLQSGDIQGLVTNDLVGSEVTFRAVVLSNPLQSGLSNPGLDGFPNYINVFVRDLSAALQGNAGMNTVLHDATYQTTGLLNVVIGDVIEVTGAVNPFGTWVQVNPTQVTVLGTLEDFNLAAGLKNPVEITTADANTNQGTLEYQTNWTTFPSLRGQFVRIERATVISRDLSTSRPNWIISSDDGETVLNVYDASLRYRNDRGGYPDIFDKRSNTYQPPPVGARINIEGFLTHNGDDPFGVGVPAGAILSINPFEDSHVEIVESPPVAKRPTKPDFVPTTDPFTVSTDVTVDPRRTLASVELKFVTSEAPDAVQAVAMTNTVGNTYAGVLPAQNDGIFLTYWVVATDNQGAESERLDVITRFLADSINEIADIQQTHDGGPGDSPFDGIQTTMSITGTVQSNPSVSGFTLIQDKSGLDPWSGILLARGPDLNQGDVITITEGIIDEQFGVTQIESPTVTVLSSGGSTLGYKSVTTSAFQDLGVSESHEAMLVQFNDVTVTQADARFGEWMFSSDGTSTQAVRADDASTSIPGSFNTDTFVDGTEVAQMKGLWWFSFGMYKVVPEQPSDVVLQSEDAFTATMTVDDGTGLSQAMSLQFGTQTNATDGFDVGLDQLAPPPPPSGFDARFRKGDFDYFTDIRMPLGSEPHVWSLIFQPATSNTPVSFQWDPSALPDLGSFRLKDTFGGTFVDLDMRQQSSYTLPVALTQLDIVYANTKTINLAVHAGWEMLGRSLEVDDAHYQTLFPSALAGTFFGFDGAYQTPDPAEMQACTGYWLRFAESSTVSVEGRTLQQCTWNVQEGWNMVSGPDCSLPFSSISDPNGLLLAGTLFGFDAAYQSATTLESMNGYWVRAGAPGSLTLDCATASKTTAVGLAVDTFGQLVIRGASGGQQQLYFGGSLPAGTDERAYTLPPRAQASSLQVSFTNGRYVSEEGRAEISLSGEAYPVQIEVAALPQKAEAYVLDVDGMVYPLREGEIIDLYQAPSKALRLVTTGTLEVPTIYTLEQNYPNPFNPETTIRFGLPEAANVRLEVFDALGRRIAVLKENEVTDAGWHMIRFDGGGLASGMYIYRLKAGDFVATKQLLLLK